MQEGLKIQITTNAIFPQNRHEICCFLKRFDNLECEVLKKKKIENVARAFISFLF